MTPYALSFVSAAVVVQSPIEELVSRLDGATHAVELQVMSDLLEFGPMECNEELDPELARLGVPAIVARVSSLDSDVARRAIWVLGRLGTQAQGAKAPLRVALKDDRRAIRIAAAQALSRISTVDNDLILPILMDAVSTPTTELLVDFPYIGHQTARAVPAIARVLEQSDLEMAQLAAGLLTNLGPIAAEARSQLMEATRHSDAEVRWQSLEALSQCGCVPASFLGELERIVEEDADARVQRAADTTAWFARNGDGSPLDNLLNALEAPDPRVREAALHGLRHFWSLSDSARNLVRQSMADPDDDVSYTAWRIVMCPYE